MLSYCSLFLDGPLLLQTTFAIDLVTYCSSDTIVPVMCHVYCSRYSIVPLEYISRASE